MKKDNNQIKEEKLKPLMPTLRTKKRFVKISIKAKKQFDFKEISDKLTDEIIYYMGAIDFAKGGVWFLKDKFDYNEQTLIIKVTTKYKDKLLATLSLIDKLGDRQIKVETLRVSGTLKGVEKTNS